MLTTKELLARLRDKGVKNADIARALKVTPSRVTELYDGGRALKLDEAAKLAQAFDLEQQPSPKAAALPVPIALLVAQHISLQLDRPLRDDSAQLRDIAEDLRAFFEFVTDPKVRGSIDLVEAFFQALRLRRPRPEEED